jgi:type VI secretion system protein ImpF
MPREEERPVQQSVLDRLIDNDVGAPAGEAVSRLQSVRELKAAVRRDLEWLLNTRSIAVPMPEALSEVTDSVYTYGLPDVTSLSADDPRSITRLRQMIGQAISLFEPRLGAVQVNEAASGVADSRRFRFSIEAVLKLDPSPEQVSFDTVFDVATGQYAIKEESGA